MLTLSPSSSPQKPKHRAELGHGRHTDREATSSTVRPRRGQPDPRGAARKRGRGAPQHLRQGPRGRQEPELRDRCRGVGLPSTTHTRPYRAFTQPGTSLRAVCCPGALHTLLVRAATRTALVSSRCRTPCLSLPPGPWPHHPPQPCPARGLHLPQRAAPSLAKTPCPQQDEPLARRSPRQSSQ